MPVVYLCDICNESAPKVNKVRLLNLQIICNDCQEGLKEAVKMIKHIRRKHETNSTGQNSRTAKPIIQLPGREETIIDKKHTKR